MENAEGIFSSFYFSFYWLGKTIFDGDTFDSSYFIIKKIKLGIRGLWIKKWKVFAGLIKENPLTSWKCWDLEKTI